MQQCMARTDNMKRQEHGCTMHDHNDKSELDLGPIVNWPDIKMKIWTRPDLSDFCATF